MRCSIFQTISIAPLGNEKEDGIGGSAARSADEEIDRHQEKNTANEGEILNRLTRDKISRAQYTQYVP